MTAAEFYGYREWLGVTRAWLAKRMGVEERQVARWERGERQISAPRETELRALVEEHQEQVDDLTRSGLDVVEVYMLDRDLPSGASYPAGWHLGVAVKAIRAGLDARMVYVGEEPPLRGAGVRTGDARQYVRDAISAGGGATPDEYDIDAIVAETMTYDPVTSTIRPTDEGAFWAAVERHAK